MGVGQSDFCQVALNLRVDIPKLAGLLTKLFSLVPPVVITQTVFKINSPFSEQRGEQGKPAKP